MSATLEELKDAIQETLQASGTLGKVRAQVRAAIFHALDEQDALPPTPSNENVIINELIREYLRFNHYTHAQSVFAAECGQADAEAVDREFLQAELGLRPPAAAPTVPLLYLVVGKLQQLRGAEQRQQILAAGGAAARVQPSVAMRGAGGRAGASVHTLSSESESDAGSDDDGGRGDYHSTDSDGGRSAGERAGSDADSGSDVESRSSERQDAADLGSAAASAAGATRRARARLLAAGLVEHPDPLSITH